MRNLRGEIREEDRPNEVTSSPNLRRDWGQDYDRDHFDFSPQNSFGRRSYDRPHDRHGSAADRSSLEREDYFRYRGHRTSGRW